MIDADPGHLGDFLEEIGAVTLDGEVGVSLDGHASAGLELDRIIMVNSMVEPHEPNDLLAVGDIE